MKLKSRILISFSGLVCILIFTGVINVFFLMAINKYIDELVEKRFGIEQRVQSAHLIINQIYSKIFDTLLIDINQRRKEIENLDRLATAFFHHMDVLSDARSYPNGGFTDQKRDFQTFYLVGKDLLAISTLTGLQENEEKMDRFKFYKKGWSQKSIIGLKPIKTNSPHPFPAFRDLPISLLRFPPPWLS